MESQNDKSKLTDMVMCGDHPSLTKNELNVKENKPSDERKMTYAKILAASSRTERAEGGADRTRTLSEHAMRLEARRRVRSSDAVHPADMDASAPGNRALMQAALGSFRWPPYLLCVWVLVLILTHILHCLVTMLERTLPGLKKMCHYFRQWTEEAWRGERDLSRQHLYPVSLACCTGLVYLVYFGLYAIYSVALWSIEPLCSELDEKQSDFEAKVTNYVDDIGSRTNSSTKQ